MKKHIPNDQTVTESSSITESDFGPITRVNLVIGTSPAPVAYEEMDYESRLKYEEEERAYDEERARAYDEDFELAIEDGLGRLLPWYRYD